MSTLSDRNIKSSQSFRRLLALLLLATGFVVAKTALAQDAPPPTPPDPPAAPNPPASPPADSPPAPPADPPPAAPVPTTSAPVPPPPPPPPVATVPPPPPPPPPVASVPPPVASVPPPVATAPPVATVPPPPVYAQPQPAYAQPQRDPPPPPEKAPPPASDDEDDTDGLFGPFRIGPVVGIGVPSVLSFGGTIKLTRYLGAGVNIGLIPQVKVPIYGDASLSYQEYDAYGRIYPFGGAFFLGAGVGYATVKGRFVNDINSASIAAAYGSALPAGFPDYSAQLVSEASVRSMILTPQIGFFSTWGSGFSLGIDVGAQVPIAASDIKFSTQANVSDPAMKAYVQTLVDENDKKVTDTLNTIGQTIIPTLNIRMGWLL